MSPATSNKNTVQPVDETLVLLSKNFPSYKVRATPVPDQYIMEYGHPSYESYEVLCYIVPFRLCRYYGYTLDLSSDNVIVLENLKAITISIPARRETARVTKVLESTFPGQRVTR